MQKGSHDLDSATEERESPRPYCASRGAIGIARRIPAIVVLAACASVLGAPTAGALAAGPRTQPATMLAQQQSSVPAPGTETPPAETPPDTGPDSSPPPVSHPKTSSRSTLDQGLSDKLSEYLHQHHLPYVDALVFATRSGRATSAKLSGRVRTEHGKQDAETKSRDFINEPSLRVENHIDVDANMASSVPAPVSSSAMAASSPPSAVAPVAAAASAPADPCTDLCLKDQGHCTNSCQTQAAGGAAGGDFSLRGVMGQFGQSATQMKQCNEQCQQTREHCVYDCSQARGSEPPSNAGGMASGGGGGPPAGAADHGAEGPDTPPE